MPKKQCPTCESPVQPLDDWQLTTPLKEKFVFCSLDCLIYGADNLSTLAEDDDSDE